MNTPPSTLATTRIAVTLLALLAAAFTTAPCLADTHSCSLLLKPPFSQWSDADLVTQSEKNYEYLRGVTYEYTSLLVDNRTVIRGLPKGGSEARFAPRKLESHEVKELVFRHYTTPQGFEKIRERKRLVTGTVPYVSSPYVYPDVSGVFLTTEKFKPESVGLDTSIHSRWVDVRLPEGTTVIWLEPGIYVVPGSGPVPEWLIRSVKAQPEEAQKLNKLSIVGYSPMEIPVNLEALSH